MSARSAWPSSNASPIATAMPSSATSNPVDANASQLGTRPSGMTRIALPSAKNSVAMTTKRTTGRGGFSSTALTIAPNEDSETAANITQWPGRSGPSTLPAIAAPKNATAATPATAAISPARPRQLSRGRDISTSTANHAIPGTATR